MAYAGSIGLDLPFLPDSLLGFYSAATRAWEFTAGAALALVGASSKVASSRYAVLLMWLGFGMLLSSLWLITEKTPFPGLWTLLPVSASLILLAAGLRDGVVSGVLASRLFVAIGDRSYSIYLWHWPFIVFAQLMRPNSTGVLLLAALLSLVPAFASFRWIEVPIRNSPLNGGGRLVRLVAATLVVPLTLASALGFAAHNGYWDSSVRSYQVAIQPFHSGAAAGCTEGAWRKPVACTWNLRGAGQPIYLVGDSNADHFSEAIIGAAKSSSRPLVSLTENGCEYVPVSLALTDVFAERRCRTYFEGTQRYLLAAPPGLVVVANSYSWFTHPDSEVAVGRVGSPPSRDPKVKLEALGSGLSAAVRSLDSRGHSVLLVQAVPHWKGEDAFTWATCPMLELLSRGCSHSMRLSDVFTRQGAAAEVVSSVAESSGMVALDLTSELCAGGVCSSVGNSGIIRYRDALHITVEQSQALSAVFEKAIEEVGPS